MQKSKRALILFVVVIVVMTAFSGCKNVDEWKNEVEEFYKEFDDLLELVAQVEAVEAEN